MDGDAKTRPASRDHHFVPRFVLRNFTVDGKLCVTNLRTGRQRWSAVSGTAYRPHFNSVDVPGYPADVIEEFLSKIETQAAAIIQNVCEFRCFPSSAKDRALLILFVALQITRVPKWRDTIDGVTDQFIRDVALKHLASDKERWSGVQEHAAANGFPDLPSYEDVREVIVDKQIKFVLTQNAQVKNMIELAKELVPLLAMRHWCVSTSNSGSFITSDAPVSLRNTLQKSGFWNLPGLAMSHTEVCLPLSRYAVLRGRFEVMPAQTSFNRKGVCAMNTMTISNAHRFIYSTQKEFSWMTHDHRTIEGATNLSCEDFAKRPRPASFSF